MNRTLRLQTMQAQLRRGLQVPGNAYIQRQALQRIEHEAGIIGEPVFDWLLRELNEVSDTRVVNSIVDLGPTCPGCGKSFDSQTALNGHGPARCALKKGGVPA